MNRAIPWVRCFTVALAVTASGGCLDAPPGDLRAAAARPGVADDPTHELSERYGKFAGGTSNTHNHMDDLGKNGAKDPFEVLAQRRDEGPPEVRTRLHSCQKLQVEAIANLLAAFGVDLQATGDPPTAGQLLGSAAGALGAANYDARVGEAIVWTAAGAAKLFDIFVQAAPEIIAGVEHVPQCQREGKNPKMFDGQKCDPDAVTCLLGRPASAQVLAVCSDLVASASDVETGKKVAVAAMLSAAHSCE